MADNMEKVYDLDRFVKAQYEMYVFALSEINEGKKRSHWMWYIFPQLKGLGTTHMSEYYGILNADEAREYLKHPSLGANLAQICVSLLGLETNDPRDIFGDVDAMKLRSSMTLFAHISTPGSIYHMVLDKFYSGNPDPLTLKLLGE